MRILKWLAISSLLAACVSPLAAQASEIATATAQAQGLTTRYHLAGIEKRAPAEPVVIFLSGFGAALGVWVPVLEGLGSETPVLAYDRPGAGGTSFTGGDLGPEQVSRHLHALLQTLGIPPPYIMVGHSWGGLLALHYAARFPGEVVGSVYVDPTNFLTTPADHRRLLRDLGVPEPELEAYEARMAAEEAEMPPQMPAGLRAEMKFILDSMDTDPAEWVPAQPSIPTTILLAGRMAPGSMDPAGLPPSVDPAAYFRAERALTYRQFEARIAGISGASIRRVEEAAHSIHREAPALVVEEIRRVTSLARKP